MTGSLGKNEFCFPRISMFPETKSRETLRIHCYPRDQSLSICYHVIIVMTQKAHMCSKMLSAHGIELFFDTSLDYLKRINREEAS